MMRTDVVIVGAGAAGLATALELANAGLACTIVTGGRLGEGASAWAQGGMAAVVASDDSHAAHIADTLAAGAGLCDERAVRALVAEAPLAIARLQQLGARFDRDARGHLELGLEGGHGARRIVHSGAATGAVVCETLVRAVRAAAGNGACTVLEAHTAVEVLTDRNGSACGLLVEDADGRSATIAARAVVLATGGAGALWSRTTNPASATGGGVALALRAGAVVRDLEFMQLHPTALALGSDAPALLVSEAVRGEGAVLIDATGERVFDDRGDLDSRAVVAVAMAERMAATGTDHLLLDARALGAATWAERFPTVLAACRAAGVDPVTQPIPVRPAAHSLCGGVVADLDGRTNVAGLFAVGEVASTGVHGANRLASNGLTEALVAGTRASALLASALPQPGAAVPRTRALPRLREGAIARMARAMTQHAGVLRTPTGLDSLIDAIDAERVRGSDAGAAPTDRRAADAHLVSQLIALAARSRVESRGVHHRLDAPHPLPEWRRHLDWRLDALGFTAVPTSLVVDERVSAA